MADDVAQTSWWMHDCPPDEGFTRPLPQEPVAAEVVVVGLGASGLEAVVVLAEHGVDVVGLDAVGIGAGAAGANGGFLLGGLSDFHHRVVQRHGRAAAVSWWHRTAAEMDRLEAMEPSVRRVGSLRIAVDEEEERDCLIHLAQMRRDGLDAAAYDGPEGRGLIIPGDAVFHPAARCRSLARRAATAGARLFAPAPVSTVLPHVVTPQHPVRADRVIVAVDGGLESLVPALRDRVRTARLQMLATAPVPPPLLPRPVYTRFGMDYFQQRPTGEVLLGGGRDKGGEQEWGAPPIPSDPVQRHLRSVLVKVGLGGTPVPRRWAARAAFSNDGLPIDTEIAAGVHVVGGYSGHGNVIGGLLARQAARRLLG